MSWNEIDLSVDASSWELSCSSGFESVLTLVFDPTGITHETGDEVTLLDDSTVIWGGHVHNKGEFQEDGTVKVEVWGYGCELLDTVVTVDRSSASPETILGDVFSGTDYTLSTPVATGLTVAKYEFKGKARIVISEMLDYSGYVLRMDYATKTVYFEEEGRTSSGLSLGGSGIGCTVKRWEIEDTSRIVNRVYVVSESVDVDGNPTAYQGTDSDATSIGLYGEKAYTCKVDFLESDSECDDVAGKLLRVDPGGGGLVLVAFDDIGCAIVLNKEITLEDTVRNINGTFIVLEQTVGSSGECTLTLSWDRSEGFVEAMRESNAIGLERMKVVDSEGGTGSVDISDDTDIKDIDTTGTVSDIDMTFGGTMADDTLAQQSSVAYNNNNTITTADSWQTISSFACPSSYAMFLVSINVRQYMNSGGSGGGGIFWRLKNSTRYYPSSSGIYIDIPPLSSGDYCVWHILGLISDSNWTGSIEIQVYIAGSANDDFYVAPFTTKIPHHAHGLGSMLQTPDPHGYTEHTPSISPSPDPHDHPITLTDIELDLDIKKLIRNPRDWLLG